MTTVIDARPGADGVFAPVETVDVAGSAWDDALSAASVLFCREFDRQLEASRRRAPVDWDFCSGHGA